MVHVLVIVAVVWLATSCVVAPFAIALLRAAARADEREEVLRREAERGERLERERHPEARRFAPPARSSWRRRSASVCGGTPSTAWRNSLKRFAPASEA